MLALGLGLGVQSGIGNNTPIIQGARFDGTNDYLLRGAGLTGAADTKFAIIATRFKLNGGDGVGQSIIQSEGGKIIVDRLANNTLRIFGRNAAGTNILTVVSSVTILADGYHNLLIGIDLANQANSFMYLDDVDVSVYSLFTNDSIGYSVPLDYSIGAAAIGITKLNGDVHSLYANFAETINFSVEANRRKFFDVNGNPVYLGANGETPTGTAPIIYLAGSYGQWPLNQGTGGGFTVTGALERPLP